MMIKTFTKIILITLFMWDFWLRLINLKKQGTKKKIDETLMTVAWHPTRW